MLVHATDRESDPRILCGIMARAVLERFEQAPKSQRGREAYFNNVIRLLEMYRFDAIRDYDPQGILERKEFAQVDLKSHDEGMLAVEQALIAAHQAVFPDVNKEQAVHQLRHVLGEIRDHGADAVVGVNETEQAKKFFEEFRKALPSE